MEDERKGYNKYDYADNSTDNSAGDGVDGVGKLPCAVVRDILPLYIDGLTSGETDTLLRQHLKSCSSCRRKYEDMSAPEQTASASTCQGETEKISDSVLDREVDYLKKVRRKSRSRLWMGAGVTALLFVLAILGKVFFYGTPVQEYAAYLVVDNGQLTVQGELTGSAVAAVDCRVLERDGQQYLAVYQVPVSPFHKDGSFTCSVPLQEISDSGLLVAGRKITKDGIVISRRTVEVFAAAHDYVGDVSKNGALASALGIGSDLGVFTNELQTDTKPYGWNLIFQEPVEAERQDSFDRRMRAYGVVLLAGVGNLGEVSWTYTLEQADQSEEIQEITKTLTLEQASQMAGKDIKDCGATETELQMLMEDLGIAGVGTAG